jgi:hypothetical protein
MALREGLKDSEAARQFFTTFFGVISEDQPSEASFTPYLNAVTNLPAEPGRARVATWPVATILPYLACPDRHMFLKPDVTKLCADRLRFDLNYKSELNWLTYKQLLKMSQTLMDSLVEDSTGARDFIDVQSFIYVIGNMITPATKIS